MATFTVLVSATVGIVEKANWGLRATDEVRAFRAPRSIRCA